MACVTTTDAVDAFTWPAHPGPAALSLPATHTNTRSHDGQPLPTYSTVLSVVWPHVLTVSTPPSGVPEPRSSAYMSREPPKKAPSPVAHEPAVNMPGRPATAVDSGGTTPREPASATTSGSPRHRSGGGDAVWLRVAAGVRLRVGVRERVALWERERVGVALRVGVTEGVRVRLAVPVPLAVRVRVGVGEPVPVDEPLGVPVVLADPVAEALDDAVAVPLVVGVMFAVLEVVMVMEPVSVLVVVGVMDAVAVGVRVVVGVGTARPAGRHGRRTPPVATVAGTAA